ncbi:MAG TPA: LodA/GoxA family CTQ-dependent oxidase [Pyrinomonadaceae bacterium]|jgi:hypothetical protein
MSNQDSIVSYVIYPGVGIARVGNSDTDYFIGPEAPGEVPQPEGGFKDETGRIKRQAARFRIYGLNEQGVAVKEITADDAEITWRVHLANRKAGWYQFNNAMDLGQYALEARYRNQDVLGDDRKKLIIDPGPRTISGKGISGQAYQFDSGEFLGKKVYLGELRTDDEGRLLILGGYGHSASATGAQATTFANNDGWHDDVSDGPVRATLRIDGKEYEAEPAMVAVTPPNFGQGLYGVVTLYDVIYNLFCQDPKWKMKAAESPAFWRDIYPIFERLVNSQWVNNGVNFLFGENSPSNLTSPDLLAKLSNPSDEFKPVRTSLFAWLRDPDADPEEERPTELPPFYGDGFGDYIQLLRDELTLTKTQYAWMRQWAEGNFDPEEALRRKPLKLEDYPIEEQPQALDEANLESCLGGPFHPGIELTWPMRVATMWKEPFRLNILPEGEEPKDDYGPILRTEVALGPGGIVESSGPGTLTRWLGVPWQTDEASCLSGYDIGTYLPLPSFWAARVPNQVLSQRAYARMMDEGLLGGQRMKHFYFRQDWLRYFGPSYQKRINDNVARWHLLGIATEQEGPSDSSQVGLPSRLWVETGLSSDLEDYDPTWEQVKIAEHVLQVAELEKVAIFTTAKAIEKVMTERAATPVKRRRRTFRQDEL